MPKCFNFFVGVIKPLFFIWLSRVCYLRSSVQLFATPWTVACQASLSMEFPRQDWVAISFSRVSSWPRNRTQVSCTGGRVFTNWATREVPESWVPKNWCFWTVVLEKNLENPLDNKEIQPVYPKGNQSWLFIGRTDAEALILWPPDAKNWLIGKDPGSGKDWRQEEKGMAENEMVGWYHWFNGHEFEQAPGHSEGQGSLALKSMGSQRVRQDWVTELTERYQYSNHSWSED